MTSRRFLVILGHSLHVRNFVASGCLDQLASRGHSLTVLMPGNLIAEVGRLNGVKVGGTIEPIEPYLGGRLARTVRRWARVASFVQRRGLRTYRYRIRLRMRSPWFLFQVGLFRALERFVHLEHSFRRSEAWFPPRRTAEALVERIAPDVLFFPTLVHDGSELEIQKAARRRGIPTVGFVASWDTLTSKGFFIVPPDYLLVWGEESARHAVEYHGFSDQQVFVTGAPHLDVYGAGALVESREAFLSRRGIDLAKRVILFAGTTVSYWEDEPLQLRALSEAVASGELKDCVIWYRPHPRRAYRDVAPLRDLPGVYVDDQVIRQKTEGAASYSTRPDDLLHYRSLMDACEGVITAFSTMIIEAALLGKPSLVVGFGLKDGGRNRLRHHSEFEHMREVIQFHGVTLCERLDDVVTGIRRILAGDFESMADVLQKRAGQIARNLDSQGKERIIVALEEILARGTLT